MDPHTPLPRPARRKKKIGLSEREYNKITGTIASVRKTRHLDSPRVERDDSAGERDREWAMANEPSYIAETSFVNAPLNSRINPASPSANPRVRYAQDLSPVYGNFGPGMDKVKGKNKDPAEEEPLDKMPLDVQEAAILEDLLFVLVGIEGVYITHHPEYSPEDEEPEDGIRFWCDERLGEFCHPLF